MDKRHVVNTRTQVRYQITHPAATLTRRFPVPRTFHAHPGIALEQFNLPAGIEFFSVATDQFRLVIEHIALARGTRHEELDHPVSLGPVMKSAIELSPRRELLREHGLG